MLITKLHTPEGVKDYLPNECEIKNKIENIISDLFIRYGFRPVSTPTIEYAEVFDYAGGIDSKRMYRFIDRDGTLLALRPDVTPSIARIAATENDDTPKKLYYIGNTFRRNESYQGKLREFTQAGIEIMGSKNTLGADVEAIALAIKSLLEVGIDNFKIDIGHAEFLTGVIEEADICEETAQNIKDNILNKNYVAVSDIAEKIENKNIASVFKDLPLLIGGYDILEAAKNRVKNEKSLNAVSYLSKVYEVIKALKYEKYISFDLSVIGAMDYYTGIIFRGYAKGTGFSVLDGGRYDKMASAFGKNIPAVGFAIKINDIIDLADSDSSGANVFIAYKPEYIADAFKFAQKVTDKGIDAELSELGEDCEINLEYAENRNINLMYYFKDRKPQLFYISDDEDFNRLLEEDIEM